VGYVYNMWDLRATLRIQTGSIIDYSYKDRLGGQVRVRAIVVRIKVHRTHFLSQLVVVNPSTGHNIIFMSDVCNIIAI